ncbi:MAG: hypothetical protein K1X83_00925 [Oligoflexia bacterium]|nr:hypothetical protein [Oligoflexia bacterium]
MTLEGSLNSDKYKTLTDLLRHEYALIHVCTRAAGVVLPSNLTAADTITLKLSHYFRGLLEVTEDKVNAQLLFGKDYFGCEIPLEAIWGITGFDGKNRIWPESAPSSVLGSVAQAGETKAAQEPRRRAPTVKKTGTHLRRVK